MESAAAVAESQTVLLVSPHPPGALLSPLLSSPAEPVLPEARAACTIKRVPGKALM